MSDSDLTQAQIFDQTEKKEPVAFSKKPQNMDDMIQLYMEMYMSHQIMEARISKLENRLNTVSTLLFKNKDTGN